MMQRKGAPSVAEQTAKLIAFMGRTHGCEITTKDIFRKDSEGNDKDIVRREVTWKKETVRMGEQEHTFFIYEGMSEEGEQKEILSNAQRKLDIIFG